MSGRVVYVGMSADIIHPGHINLLERDTKHGAVKQLWTEPVRIRDHRLPSVPCFSQERALTAPGGFGGWNS